MSKWPLIIVPVYNAANALRSCLTALEKNSPINAEVLLINDASTDTEIQPLLNAFLKNSHWRLQTNTTNLGFVKTANRGLRQANGHALLLNSDTIVGPNWLKLMTIAADSEASVATVTPWTNNGEIVSLPNFCQANPLPDDIASVAACIATTTPCQYPELPTAVGFCMLITAAAIDRLGYFDEHSFGLGYGEENDYSRRAVAEGMRNILCDNVYVAHLGNQSFGPRGLGPDNASMQSLLRQHPDYLEVIQAYIAADPLADRRRQILSALESAGIELANMAN